MDKTGHIGKSLRTQLFLTTAVLFVLLTGSNSGNALAQTGGASNKAAQIKMLDSTFTKELEGQKAPEGKIFVVCETEWENIHPKQKVEKDKLEGKVDRTMGVGGFASKKKTEKDTEYVDMDVAYQVRKLQDHLYLIADGTAFALHGSTEEIPGGYKMKESFTISKQGETKNVKLAFLIPDDRENLCLQMFDYQYGHITLPVKGSLQSARGSGEPSGKTLGRTKTDMAEFAAHDLDFQNEYAGNSAPEGWRYAVVQFSGKSLSGDDVRDIVQFKPEENIWVSSEGGYLYNCAGSSTALDGFVRFTPEFFQYQELAFLVPETAESLRMGIRVRNLVLHIDLTDNPLEGLPGAIATHQDGDVMEVMLFGMRKEQEKIIVDLGIRSLYDRGGLEIQAERQFFLLAGEEEHKVDRNATQILMHRPPQPFVIPPGETVRFELAFDSSDDPSFLRFRGYSSEGRLKF